MIWILDTDTFILLLRGTAIAKSRSAREENVRLSAGRILVHCKKRVTKGDVIGLSAISLAELEFGIRHGGHYEKHHKAMREILAPFHVFSFDAVDCVHHYGIVRSALESQGRGIGPLDTLIAAHALALGAVLVTHNQREFKRVAGLLTEDWS